MISNDKKSFHFVSQAGPESTWTLKVRKATVAQHRLAEPPTGGGMAANSGGIRLVTYWGGFSLSEKGGTNVEKEKTGTGDTGVSSQV